jgi:hypothetical protein
LTGTLFKDKLAFSVDKEKRITDDGNLTAPATNTECVVGEQTMLEFFIVEMLLGVFIEP